MKTRWRPIKRVAPKNLPLARLSRTHSIIGHKLYRIRLYHMVGRSVCASPNLWFCIFSSSLRIHAHSLFTEFPDKNPLLTANLFYHFSLLQFSSHSSRHSKVVIFFFCFFFVDELSPTCFGTESSLAGAHCYKCDVRWDENCYSFLFEFNDRVWSLMPVKYLHTEWSLAMPPCTWWRQSDGRGTSVMIGEALSVANKPRAGQSSSRTSVKAVGT